MLLQNKTVLIMSIMTGEMQRKTEVRRVNELLLLLLLLPLLLLLCRRGQYVCEYVRA